MYEEGVCKIEPLKYKVPTQYGRFGTSNLEVLGSIPGKSALPGDRTQDLEVRSPESTRTALPPYISTGKSVPVISGFYGNR